MIRGMDARIQVQSMGPCSRHRSKNIHVQMQSLEIHETWEVLHVFLYPIRSYLAASSPTNPRAHNHDSLKFLCIYDFQPCRDFIRVT